MTTLKIINGKIPNFDQMKLEEKDVLIKDGKIEKIGKIEEEADQVIDAKGKVVSPGFIDIHMHEEVIENVEDPYFTSYYELKMGTTTCVGGNCGNNRQSVKEFKDYIDKNGAPVNYLSFIGHNYLRNQVGIDDRYRAATDEEIEKMKELIKETLPLGILGISYGIEYSPGIDFRELVEITKALDSKDYLLSAHYRSDGEKSVESIEEMVKISTESGVPMQIAHIGSCSAFGFMKETLDMIKEYQDKGADVMADCYPYDAFATFIGSAVFDDGCFERWDKTYSDILLTEEPMKNVRCDKETFEKARKEYPNMIAAAFVMREEEVIEALKAPFVFVGSDSLFRKDMGHPRGAGSFPRVLGRYVREMGELPLIDALWKMTLGPAERLSLSHKGQIKEGMDADITIFDPDTVEDGATFAEPTLPPVGISHVILGGKVAVENNEVKEGRLGRFIKFKKGEM
ncbi:MAG: amidohydrolase family protein [Tissierellales bacterium]|jgi:N-acyl-D-amino-acid deacylase|nr:amidohydrolase family protein [Tissierellales bacterium]